MIAETAAATAAAQTAPGLTEDSLRDSLAQVLTALTGQAATKDTLTFERMSEDVLYTALMHEQLRAQKPALADALLKNIKPGYRANLNEMKRQSLSQAVDAFFQKQQSAGKLTKRAVETMSRSAFGRAQLDNSATTLRRKPTDVKLAAADGASKSAVELTLERALANQNAAPKDIAAFDKRIELHPVLSQRMFNRQKSALDELFLASDAKPPQSTTAGSSGSTEKPAAPLETDKPADLPTAAQIETGPTELVYQPESERDGKVLVMVPLKYANITKGVSLVIDIEDRIIELKHSGIGNDKRRYFRGEVAGTTLEGGATVRLWLTDGTHYDHRVGNLKKFKADEFR